MEFSVEELHEKLLKNCRLREKRYGESHTFLPVTKEIPPCLFSRIADRASQYNLSNQPTYCTKSCFIISLLYASTCFEHYVLIIRRSKLYYTASVIITPVGGRPVHRLREDPPCWFQFFVRFE